jgi:hypothetical protein
MQPNNPTPHPPTPTPPPQSPLPQPHLTEGLGGTQEHPAKEEEVGWTGEHMKREVALHRGHGFPNAVMHDVEHVDTDSEASASPA